MTPKKFVIFFIGSVFGIILLLWGLAWMVPEYTYMDRGYAVWQTKKEHAYHKSDDEEVVFLGDSRMLAAIDPTLLPRDGYNFALTAAGPIEMYFVLRNYLDNYPKPPAVFVSFAPEHLLNIDAYRQKNFQYHFFSFDEAIESQRQIFKSDGYTDKQQNKELVDDWHYFLRLPTRYGNAIIRSRLNRGKEYRKLRNEIMDKHGYIEIASGKRNNEFNWEARQTHFENRESCVFYLKGIIRLCKEKNISVHILQIPINPASEQAIRESGYREEYAEYMRGIMREFEIPTELYAPVYPEDCFGDPSHLNAHGAEVYTNELKQRYDILNN